MSQITKAFLGIIMILSMVMLSFGTMQAFLIAGQAEDLRCAVITQLEDSNFHPPVIGQCFHLAEENGCQMELELFQENGEHKLLTSGSAIPTDNRNIVMGEVTLSYPLKVPVLGIDETMKIKGYAR